MLVIINGFFKKFQVINWIFKFLKLLLIDINLVEKG